MRPALPIATSCVAVLGLAGVLVAPRPGADAAGAIPSRPAADATAPDPVESIEAPAAPRPVEAAPAGNAVRPVRAPRAADTYAAPAADPIPVDELRQRIACDPDEASVLEAVRDLLARGEPTDADVEVLLARLDWARQAGEIEVVVVLLDALTRRTDRLPTEALRDLASWSEDERIRLLAVELLARAIDPLVAEVLDASAAGDESAEVRILAIRALADQIAPIAVVEAAREALRDETDPEVAATWKAVALGR